MAYASGSSIEAIDYNNLAWGSDAGGTYVTTSTNKNIAVVWGVGTGRFGWGQNTSSIPKAIINAITTATACTGSTITVGDSTTIGVNEAIKFGSAIGGLTAGATYYVYDKPTTNTLRVAATVNATAPIDLTTQSSLSVTVLPVDFATGSLTQVAATNNVTAAQWNGLILATNKALYHTGGANVAVTGVSVGTPIAYYSAVSTAVTTVWNNANTGSVGFTTDDAALTSTNTVTWANSIGFVYTVDFGSADEMRYFFNAGGKIKFSLTGPAGTGRNLDWRTLCTAMGTIVFGYNTTTKSGGSGTPDTLLSTVGNGGFWGPHTSGVDREDFQQTSTGTAYTTNYIEILTKVSGVTAGSSGGKGTRLTFTINLVDANSNIYQPAVATGTVASMVVVRPTSSAVSVTGPSGTGVTKTTDAGTTTAYAIPTGSQTFTTVGDTTFTVPADVTSVSAFVVAPGGFAGATAGGGGGGSAYIGTVTVTPGQTLYVRVGDKNASGASTASLSIVSTTTPIDSSLNYLVATAGASTGTGNGGSGAGVGAFAAGVGANAGQGGQNPLGGGGGAAGYGGTAGNGGYPYVSGNQQLQGAYIYGAQGGGTGAGGGGGGVLSASAAGGGGGVGLNGIGTPGSSGGGTSTPTTQTAGTPGGGGSGGASGSVKNGGDFGGGGGGTAISGTPGGGAVRIIWGPSRSYPSQAA